MAIAKYFSKDLLAINQLLKSKAYGLEQILTNVQIGIYFDDKSIQENEGRLCCDLLVRLISRLYPKIAIVNDDASARAEELITLAKSINRSIDIETTLDNCTCVILLGDGPAKVPKNCQTFFIGSDNWIGYISQTKPKSFGNSSNPFGPGIAACIVLANVFKFTLSDFFSQKLDKEIAFSALELSATPKSNPAYTDVNLNRLCVVGIGAIGSGLLWAFSKIPTLNGTLDLIDHESISLSNLQRYVLFGESDEGSLKVEKAKLHFNNPNLLINAFDVKWSAYLNKTQNWNNLQVAVAIDNKKDRIAIQSSLPFKIFNAYTEENLIGVATHADFVNAACLACGYIPNQKERNYTEEVAVNCNIPNHANFVKDYLNLNLPVDARYNNNTVSMLDVISTANAIPREALIQFHGKRIEQFYSEFICGGISMSLSTIGQEKVSNVDAPLAFQSAMAGILLAARIVGDALGLNKSFKQQSHIYPLNPIAEFNPYNHNLQKDTTGSCICADQVFIERYKSKWPVNEKN
ncbi:MAG TPA: E2 ligase fold family C protein [Cyclobacteriaceae bacterium]|nr:E2 ligase fold family C protein [Cyclobacteriaceae bacterium]